MAYPLHPQWVAELEYCDFSNFVHSLPEATVISLASLVTPFLKAVLQNATNQSTVGSENSWTALTTWALVCCIVAWLSSFCAMTSAIQTTPPSRPQGEDHNQAGASPTGGGMNGDVMNVVEELVETVSEIEVFVSDR